MKPVVFLFLTGLLFLAARPVHSQTSDTINYNYGVWQHISDPISKSLTPEIRGRTCNFTWKMIEPAPGQWDWVDFDSQLVSRAADTLPILFMIYTKEDAPEWLYDNGVPRVIERNNAGEVIGHAPYYIDEEYTFYFKRMISEVRKHMDSLPAFVRKQIVGVQACFGSTGDYIGYKGTVNPQYFLREDQLFSLFKEFTLHYYNEYLTTNPRIYVLSNPPNNVRGHFEWLADSCSSSWIKVGTIGKGYQLNDEKTKATWLMPELNALQKGSIMRSRCEIVSNGLYTGWWDKYPNRNMFNIMAYGIHWGLDWSNQGDDQLAAVGYDSAFFFFNKYAGQKDTLAATNAMCLLKDVIDAADAARFPPGQFGTVEKTATRYNNVLAPFIPYGARLDDINTALQSENENTEATALNDVGWDLFPGNYERYLHQINANATSTGYWNVMPDDTITMYGRFARGFELNKGKDALYFDINNGFLGNEPVNSKYPVIIDITYLDSTFGSFQVFYDAANNANKLLATITCNNTRQWKKFSITVKDGWFANRGANGSDFYIKSAPDNRKDILFAVVEFARPNKNISNTGIFATAVSAPFDTICINSISPPKGVTLSGAFLTTRKIVVGPKPGFSFALSADGPFRDTVIIGNIDAYFKKDVFIRFNPATPGDYSGDIPVKGGGIENLSALLPVKAARGGIGVINPIKGGGLPTTKIPVKAYAVNSNPDVAADVRNISCRNAKDGAINLTTTGGIGPFTFNWVIDTTTQKFFTEDISGLFPATYTATIGAYAGCSKSYSYTLTQPEALVTTLSYDAMICRNGTTNLYVNATGGTLPYSGTGTFVVPSGYQLREVTDANGCKDQEGINIVNGTNVPPAKPGRISGLVADTVGVCPSGSYSFSISSVSGATAYLWNLPSGSTIGSASADSTQIVLQTNASYVINSSLGVRAANVCGISDEQTRVLGNKPLVPGAITGPGTVRAQQTGIVYSVPAVAGLTYSWAFPAGVVIVSGQNTATVTVNWGNNAGNVAVKANNSCTQSAATTLSVTITTAAARVEDQYALQTITNTATALSLYPNPARQRATISFNSAASGHYRIRIATTTGQVVSTFTGTCIKGQNNNTIAVHQLPPGVYILTLYKGNEPPETTRFIVQR